MLSFFYDIVTHKRKLKDNKTMVLTETCSVKIPLKLKDHRLKKEKEDETDEI